jgi:hypothetical protein
VFSYGQASSNHASDERAIRQLNGDVLKAYNLGDVKTLDRVEDVDFTLTGDFGEVTKAQQIDDVSHRKPNATSVNVIVANARFRFYGDSALLTDAQARACAGHPRGQKCAIGPVARLQVNLSIKNQISQSLAGVTGGIFIRSEGPAVGLDCNCRTAHPI